MRATLICSLLLSGLTTAAHADVLVVDGVGALPGRHGAIQDAVLAASSGDTILVDATIDASGMHALIVGKGLSILSDTDDVQVDMAWLVARDIPAGQSLTLRGLRAHGGNQPALVFDNIGAALRLFDVTAAGWLGWTQTTTAAGRDGGVGAVFTDCDDVIATNSLFYGGVGGTLFGKDAIAATSGGIGALVSDSRLTAFDTLILGGRGGKVTEPQSAGAGGHGGAALIADDSVLTFWELAPQGGDGGDTLFGPAGDGGTGLSQEGPSSITRLTYCDPIAGDAGVSSFAAQGVDGQALVQLGGSVVDIPGSKGYGRDLGLTTPVRVGEPISVTGIGFQDEYWLLYGFETGHQLLPAHEGVLAVGAPLAGFVYVGYVPVLSKTFPLGPAPALPPGFDIATLQLQAVHVAPGGAFVLGEPEQLVVLDASF